MTDSTDALIHSHIGLAKSLAWRFARHVVPTWRDEFESAALYGLVEAARCRDVDDPEPFGKLATTVIIRRMIEARRKLFGHEKAAPRPRMEPLPAEDLCYRDPAPAEDDFWALVAALPEREQRLLALVFRDGLTRTEAGRALGMGRWAAMHAYDRAINQLRGAVA